MKVKLIKPLVVKCLPGIVEVDEREYERLTILNAIENVEERELPEDKIERKTRKKK